MKTALFPAFVMSLLLATPAHAQLGGIFNTLRQIRGTIYDANGVIRDAKGAIYDTTSTVKQATSIFSDLCSTLGVPCEKNLSRSTESSTSQNENSSTGELNKIYGSWYKSLSQDEKEAAQYIVLEAAQGTKTDFKKFSTSSWFTSKSPAQQSKYASIFYKASEVIDNAEKTGSKQKFLAYAFCIHSSSQSC